MAPPAIDSTQALQDWFHRSGVVAPLTTCVGPLPRTGASIARWSRSQPDARIQTIQPHPGSYRIALMLEPLESQIWVGDRPVWGGMIGANRFRICPPGSTSQWRQLSGCDIVNVFVPVETIDQLCRDGHMPNEQGLASTLFAPDRLVLDLVWKLLEAPERAGALSTQYSDGIVTALLCYLLERYSGLTTAEPASGTGLSGSRLRKVMAFIEEHIVEELPIAVLAERCGMSESHFSRAFRAAVGMPPHQFMMKRRLERACEALQHSDAKVVDIALDLGFSDASHFSRAFAQRHGMPPAQYRRQSRG